MTVADNDFSYFRNAKIKGKNLVIKNNTGTSGGGQATGFTESDTSDVVSDNVFKSLSASGGIGNTIGTSARGLASLRAYADSSPVNNSIIGGDIYVGSARGNIIRNNIATDLSDSSSSQNSAPANKIVSNVVGGPISVQRNKGLSSVTLGESGVYVHDNHIAVGSITVDQAATAAEVTGNSGTFSAG